MILRRLPVLAASVIATVAFLEVARDTPAPEPAVFATIPAPWMPSVPSGSALTSTWFCPGVPADGAEGSGGAFVLANAGPAPMQARVTLLAGPGQAVELPMTVEPYSRATVDPSASVAAPFVGAMVEIDRGGGLVEQWATQPAGTSVAPCTTQPSSEWYLAEGFTAENSSEQLVLANPYDQSAIVDIGFATADGSRLPLESHPVPARSVEVIDMDALAARDEPEVAVSVVAQRGQIVVGRAQLYDGGGRLGYSMTLAAPSARSQWWFANGLKGPDVVQRFSLYNPTEEAVEVTPAVPRHQRGRDGRADRRAGPGGGDVLVRWCGRAARRAPRPRLRHCRLVGLDHRRAGDHAHDRRHPDDVGAPRGDGAGRGRLRTDDVDVRHRTR